MTETLAEKKCTPCRGDAVDLDLGAGPFSELHAVASLQVDRECRLYKIAHLQSFAI